MVEILYGVGINEERAIFVLRAALSLHGLVAEGVMGTGPLGITWNPRRGAPKLHVIVWVGGVISSALQYMSLTVA